MKKIFLIGFLLLIISTTVYADSANQSGWLSSFITGSQATRSVYVCVALNTLNGTIKFCNLVERKGDGIQPGEYADYNSCSVNCR